MSVDRSPRSEVGILPQPKRDDLITFVNAFRRAVEVEYGDGSEPPMWLRNGYDDARKLCQLTPDIWPAPWEREA